MSITSPIVGAHFRPPAKAILQCSPAGAALWLEREPSNPYDSNAIKVMCDPSIIHPDQEEVFTALIAGHGLDFDEFGQEAEYQLGYIPRTEAEGYAPQWDALPNAPTTIPGTLAFAPDGKPQIEWTFPES